MQSEGACEHTVSPHASPCTSWAQCVGLITEEHSTAEADTSAATPASTAHHHHAECSAGITVDADAEAAAVADANANAGVSESAPDTATSLDAECQRELNNGDVIGEALAEKNSDDLLYARRDSAALPEPPVAVATSADAITDTNNKDVSDSAIKDPRDGNPDAFKENPAETSASTLQHLSEKQTLHLLILDHLARSGLNDSVKCMQKELAERGNLQQASHLPPTGSPQQQQDHVLSDAAAAATTAPAAAHTLPQEPWLGGSFLENWWTFFWVFLREHEPETAMSALAAARLPEQHAFRFPVSTAAAASVLENPACSPATGLPNKLKPKVEKDLLVPHAGESCDNASEGFPFLDCPKNYYAARKERRMRALKCYEKMKTLLQESTKPELEQEIQKQTTCAQRHRSASMCSQPEVLESPSRKQSRPRRPSNSDDHVKRMRLETKNEASSNTGFMILPSAAKETKNLQAHEVFSVRSPPAQTPPAILQTQQISSSIMNMPTMPLVKTCISTHNVISMSIPSTTSLRVVSPNLPFCPDDSTFVTNEQIKTQYCGDTVDSLSDSKITANGFDSQISEMSACTSSSSSLGLWGNKSSGSIVAQGISANASKQNFENKSTVSPSFLPSSHSEPLSLSKGIAETTPMKSHQPPQLVFDSVLNGHDSRILCCCFDRAGTYFATGGHDRKVMLWSLVQRRVVSVILGHKQRISALCFAQVKQRPHNNRHYENLLVTASYDSTVCIWDLTKIEAPRLLRTIRTGSGVVVTAVTTTLNDSVLCTVDSEGGLGLYCILTGRECAAASKVPRDPRRAVAYASSPVAAHNSVVAVAYGTDILIIDLTLNPKRSRCISGSSSKSAEEDQSVTESKLIFDEFGIVGHYTEQIENEEETMVQKSFEETAALDQSDTIEKRTHSLESENFALLCNQRATWSAQPPHMRNHIWNASWARDSKVLVTVSEDTIALWNAESRFSLMHVIPAQESLGRIMSAAILRPTTFGCASCADSSTNTSVVLVFGQYENVFVSETVTGANKASLNALASTNTAISFAKGVSSSHSLVSYVGETGNENGSNSNHSSGISRTNSDSSSIGVCPKCNLGYKGFLHSRKASPEGEATDEQNEQNNYCMCKCTSLPNTLPVTNSVEVSPAHPKGNVLCLATCTVRCESADASKESTVVHYVASGGAASRDGNLKLWRLMH